MDYYYESWLGMNKVVGNSYTKGNFVSARASKETHSSLDGLEGKVEEWTKVPLA